MSSQEERFERWIDVIADDIATGAAATAGFMAGWWRGVAGWFRFVHFRKPDKRFPVSGGLLRSAEMAAIAATAILMTVIAVDPLFIAMLNDRSAAGIAFFRRLTELGEAAWALYLIGALLLAFSLVPRGALARRRRIDLHDLQLGFYFLFTTVAFSGLIATALKNAIGRARPEFTPDGMVWLGRSFADNYDFASFPSGHATTAGALAMGLALLAPRLRVFLLLAGVWIAVSRPVLGVHFPSDILAGFCFGAWFSWIYARSFARKRLLFAFAPDGSLHTRPGFTVGYRTGGGREA